MRNRLVIVFLVPLIAIVLALSGAYAWSAARSVQQSFYSDQFGDLTYFVTSARQSLRADTPAVLEGEVRRFQDVYGIRVVVVDVSGEVWAASGPDSAVLEETESERVQLALSGRRSEPPEPTFPLIDNDAVMAEPVFDDSDVIGVVLISSSTDSPRSEILQHWFVLSLIVIATILAGLLLVFGLANWVLAPVRRLDQAMVAIERGEMDARVSEDTGPPELRRMTVLFNSMAAEIERVLARQQEFALNASHELRNPLNALLLRVEHLMTGLGREWREDIEETREEGRRMTRILETLLSLAKGGRGDASFAAVDLAGLARRRAEAWREVAGRRSVTVEVTGDRAVPTMADRTVLESALDAVIDNAVKYSPEGGHIEIRAVAADGRTGIAVRDNGPGLEASEVGSATERFWRSSETGTVSGSGLGLAIATDLLASIGGELSVEAPDDGGLLVSLWIPDGAVR